MTDPLGQGNSAVTVIYSSFVGNGAGGPGGCSVYAGGGIRFSQQYVAWPFLHGPSLSCGFALFVRPVYSLLRPSSAPLFAPAAVCPLLAFSPTA